LRRGHQPTLGRAWDTKGRDGDTDVAIELVALAILVLLTESPLIGLTLVAGSAGTTAAGTKLCVPTLSALRGYVKGWHPSISA
jgi:hypothetical protein